MLKASVSLVLTKPNLLLLCLVKICSPHTCSFIYSTHESLSNLSCELQMKRQNNYYYKWYDKTTFLQGRGRRVGWKAIIVKSLIEMSFLLLRHTYISRKSWSEKKLLLKTTLTWHIEPPLVRKFFNPLPIITVSFASSKLQMTSPSLQKNRQLTRHIIDAKSFLSNNFCF